MATRTVTGKTTIPAGVAAVGTVTSDTNDNTILHRSQFTAWVSAGAVTAGNLKVYEDQVWENITGVNTATAPDVDKTNWKPYKLKHKSYDWIYLPTDGAGTQKVAKILGVNQLLDAEASTYKEIYQMDKAIATTGAVAFEFVTGNLKNYSLDNNGGAGAAADGEYDGKVLVANQIINADDEYIPMGRKNKDVKTLNGTGTSVFVVENL